MQRGFSKQNAVQKSTGMPNCNALSGFCTAFALVATAAPTPAQAAGEIQLSQLQGMFADMRAKTKWNLDGPMLSGYFFFDPEPKKLELAASELRTLGYRFVNLQQVAGRQTFRLHVERVEVHSPESLNARNNEFYALARKYSLASYDGMDVGPAAASPAK